jgi:hypothetical protein
LDHRSRKRPPCRRCGQSHWPPPAVHPESDVRGRWVMWTHNASCTYIAGDSSGIHRPHCPRSHDNRTEPLFVCYSGPLAVRRLGRQCDAEGRFANRCLSEASFDSRPRREALPSAAARSARRLFSSPFWPVKKGTGRMGTRPSTETRSLPAHIPHAYQNKSPPRTIRPTLAYRMHRRTIHDEDLAERSGCAGKAQADSAPTGEIVRE